MIYLAVTGGLNHNQLSVFKEELVRRVGLQQGLTERLFEPGRVTYELLYRGGAQGLSAQLAQLQLEGFYSQVVSTNAQEIILDVRPQQ